ncbi:MAG TPA: tripartite tricarboxylate transporter TctB family protein [Chloroflexota bacterium]|nr:tripartite tricarboxylate transporter TctB family protein [Chloroflexota bacterium]
MSRKQADLIFSLVLLAIVGWMTWEAQKWDRRAGLFPAAIGIPATILCLLQLGFATRALLLAPAAPSVVEPQAVGAAAGGADGVVAQAVEQAFGAGSEFEAEEAIPQDVSRRRTRQMVMWILIITAGIVVFGFELGSAIISFAFLRLAAHEKVRLSLIISLLTYLFFYIVFDRALSIPFPAGLLAEALGRGEPLDHALFNPIADLIQNR